MSEAQKYSLGWEMEGRAPAKLKSCSVKEASFSLLSRHLGPGAAEGISPARGHAAHHHAQLPSIPGGCPWAKALQQTGSVLFDG